MKNDNQVDLDLTLQTLNFATRQIASELNRERLIAAALDTLADFGRSRSVALLSAHNETKSAELVGLFDQGAVGFPGRAISAEAAASLDELFKSAAPKRFTVNDCPFSGMEPFKGINKGEFLCLPLIGPHDSRLGVAILHAPAEPPLASREQQILIVLATLIAAAMENSRLFDLATVDGLTGLYVRRYFELRLQEELARIKRHGGSVGLLITDIDHFKTFNDTYGHQQGDIVLSHLALVLKKSVRIDLDIPCRYGGEEYVTILPGSDIAGALILAERFRANVEAYPFPGQTEPLKVTVSGGVAVADAGRPASAEDLLKRADEMLYKAKDSGRNRVFAWERS